MLLKNQKVSNDLGVVQDRPLTTRGSASSSQRLTHTLPVNSKNKAAGWKERDEEEIYNVDEL